MFMMDNEEAIYRLLEFIYWRQMENLGKLQQLEKRSNLYMYKQMERTFAKLRHSLFRCKFYRRLNKHRIQPWCLNCCQESSRLSIDTTTQINISPSSCCIYRITLTWPLAYNMHSRCTKSTPQDKQQKAQFIACPTSMGLQQ